jgi:thiol-disulfide isomerase/thioredoxin
MKKLTMLVFVFLSLFTVSSFADTQSSQASASASSVNDTVTIHFFYSKDCPHCVAAHPFINKLKAEYPWLRVKEYEVSGNPRNGKLFEKMSRAHGKEPSFFPTFFIGDKAIIGYTSASTTGAEIRDAANAAHSQ